MATVPLIPQKTKERSGKDGHGVRKKGAVFFEADQKLGFPKQKTSIHSHHEDSCKQSLPQGSPISAVFKRRDSLFDAGGGRGQHLSLAS